MNHVSPLAKRWLRGLFALIWSALPLLATVAFDTTDGVIPHASGWQPARIAVQRVPPFVPATTAGGEVLQLTLEDIHAHFIAAGANWPVVEHRHTRFFVADHRWMERFLDWQHSFLWEFDHRYRREVFDCDDFSVSMMAFVDLAVLRAGVPAQAAVVGRLVVNQRERWANAPAGGMHEVILLATDRGLLVVEPQNRWTTALKDYPNRAHLLRLILN